LGLELGAFLVVFQTGLSGVLSVPISTFMVTMLGVHLLVGLVEGLITAAVLEYIREVRSDVIADVLPGGERFSRRGLMVSMGVITLAVAGVLSLFASGSPDGLEWSYAERPDDPGFESIVVNENSKVEAVEEFQSAYSPMPDYSIRNADENVSAGWTSFAGVLGAFLTMGLVWLSAKVLRAREKLEPGV
jgi:cobalt/nickel transport system permease protein